MVCSSIKIEKELSQNKHLNKVKTNLKPQEMHREESKKTQGGSSASAGKHTATSFYWIIGDESERLCVPVYLPHYTGPYWQGWKHPPFSLSHLGLHVCLLDGVSRNITVAIILGGLPLERRIEAPDVRRLHVHRRPGLVCLVKRLSAQTANFWWPLHHLACLSFL